MFAAGLLVAAGLPKLTATPEADTGLPDWVPNGRVLGAAEIGVGLWVLLTGSALAAGTMALMYLGFTAITAWQHRVGVEDCGCFGARPVRPGGLHVALNAAFTVGAVATVFLGWPSMSAAATVGVAALAVVGGHSLAALLGEAAEVSRLVGESEAARTS